MSSFLLFLVLVLVVYTVLKLVRFEKESQAYKKPTDRSLHASDANVAGLDETPNAPSDSDEALQTDLTIEPNHRRLPMMELTYTNTSEVTQRRIIQPYRARANTDYFEAYCQLEENSRSFRFDRVSHAINRQTGEALSQQALYLLIHPKRKAPEWLIDTPQYLNES